MAHVILKEARVEFPIFNAHTRSVRAALFSKLGGTLSAANKTVIVSALETLNLEFRDGDRVGLIGHNGAGKTTLLRVVSGAYVPTSGTAEIAGRTASFTDIALGMDPEATGWDNILFRAVFMGLTFKEARELRPKIAEFSELGSFLEVPVRTYSTGMFVRLAFAISTSVYPDIVVMDEMINAGDTQFMVKAQARLRELIANSKILFLASHDMGLIERNCNKALWLEKGRLKQFGETGPVAAAYLASLKTP